MKCEAKFNSSVYVLLLVLGIAQKTIRPMCVIATAIHGFYHKIYTKKKWRTLTEDCICKLCE